MKKYPSAHYILIIVMIGLVSGFVLHCLNPSKSYTQHLEIEPGQLHIEKLTVNNINFKSDYRINLRVNIISDSNCTVYLVNESEYELIQDNPLNFGNLKNISTGNSNLITYSFSEQSHHYIEYYILFQNGGETVIWVYYYIGLFSISYHLGLWILIISSFVLTLNLIYIFSGIKRYFTFAIGINILVILFRMTTLEKYNSLGLQFTYDLGIPDIFTPELYNDFEFWYQTWTDPFLKGVFPYEGIKGYEFPPLFIITISLFQLIPFLPVWKSAIPIFSAHLMNGYFVYLIAQKLRPENHKTATYAMLFYYLNPISLAYGSFCWFNPSLFIFFAILSLFILIREKSTYRSYKFQITPLNLSMIVLGVGTMYKQFAFIFFVPFMMIGYGLVKKRIYESRIDIEKEQILMKSVIAYIFPMILLILPFGLVNIGDFVRYAILQPTIFDVYQTKIVNYTYPVNFNTFFVVLGAPNLLTDIIGTLIIFWIPILGTTLLMYIYVWKEVKKEDQMDLMNVLQFLVILILCIHLFYPRGVFKFYLMLLSPFFALSLFKPFNKNNKRNNFRFSTFFMIFLLIVLINRFVYFIILIVLAGYLVYQAIQYQRVNSLGLLEIKR